MSKHVRRETVALAIGLVIFLEPTIAEAESSEADCRAYADFAWKQQRANYDRKCGFTGLRWSFNTKDHLNWCLSATAAQRASEQRARADALRKCPLHWCERYSNRAVGQSGQNEHLKCGFGGPRWSGDYETHYQWCKRATRENSGNEWQARNVAINRCKAEKGLR